MSSCPSASTRAVAGLAALAVSASLIQTTSAAVADEAAAPTSQVLASTVANPSGGAVRTTFVASDVATADEGRQGSLTSLPASPSAVPAGTATGVVEPDDGRWATTPSTTDTPYQRFDVPSTGNGQVLVWKGRLDPARELVLRAWDGSRWEELGRTRGASTGAVTLEAPVAGRHTHSGVVPVLLTGEDPFADDIDHDVRDSFENPRDYDFAFVHHTDTQYVVRGSVSKKTAGERGVWQRGYAEATKWIAANAKSRKIVYAAHTGDVVDQWYTDRSPLDIARQEFQMASAAQKSIDDSGVVTSVLPGNHDNVGGTDNGPGAVFNEVFGPSRFQALAATPSWHSVGATYEPWRPGDNANSFVTFTAGGLDFVAVSMGFGVTAEEAAWADSVFKRHPDRNGVLLAHSYLSSSVSPDGRGGGTSSDGFILRDRVVAANPNVALVLSGHENGVNLTVRKDLGRKGNHVVEMLGNYQHYNMEAQDIGTDAFGLAPESEHRLGASFLRLLQFDVDRSEVSVDTYSPFMDDFGAGEFDLRNRYDGREDDFRVPVQLTSRATSFSTDGLLSLTPTSQVLGTQTVASGAQARATWNGLQVDTRYAWQATSVDATTGAALTAPARGVFTARTDAADVRPPVLQVPRSTTVAHASVFDPMAGVRARDDDGSDLLRRVEVAGRVDTATPGSTTLTYSVRDEAGNQAVASRGVAVAKGPAPRNTALPAVSGTPKVGQVLTADRGAWTNIRNADLRVQWMRNGKAVAGATGGEFRVRPEDVGTSLSAQVTARVVGRKAVTVAAANALTVPKMTPVTRVTLAKSVFKGKRAVLNASWQNAHQPVTGTVTVRVSGKVVARPKVRADGTIRVTLPAWKKVGKKKVRVVLPPSARFNGSDTVRTIELKLTKAQKLAKKKAAAKKKKEAAKKKAAKKRAAKKKQKR